MGGKARSNLPSDETDTDTISASENSFGTSREATPLPWVLGEHKLTARWITPIYGQRTEKTKNKGAKK
jgi:hypothetical protein